MVATRTIEEHETILTVPSTLMLTIDSVPQTFTELFPKRTPIHRILAAFLTHGESYFLEKWNAWHSTWPSLQSFRDCMPILWPEFLQSSKIFSKTKKKRIQIAWECVLQQFPDTNWEIFCYNWLIINTRSFYYVTPGQDEPEDWNDAVGLVPIADYFNHADDANCIAMFDQQGYTIKTTRRIEEGEEAYISYGSHPNDYLFVEYGFFLDHSQSDAIFLDDIVFQDLTAAEQEELKLYDLYGNYKITKNGACSRAKAAACIKFMDREKWRGHVLYNFTQGIDAKKMAKILSVWVDLPLKESIKAIRALETLETKDTSGYAEDEQRVSAAAKVSTVLKRWYHIRTLCEATLHSINILQDV
ncbi:uncharacterized protein ASPGLDRAFT_74880 [Aspergillus glaucus CBS 516.65]|uniref:SET domain-containing protein n=1 Tax=Aspergillus glaucus CBS 516.65 TaxID=1160497 RepID=A0A1L9VHQ6_ASPGL|nr:hypothetical protein ASPGLDRAFT_74880 [Aspergillus glaucus CBS 516.65]OJJ83430.1 hypothetical protein ASPGLDRAFT_74880 [Aspergillus glaucus CBS 516.65]